MQEKCLTVKELKELLKEADDDALVVGAFGTVVVAYWPVVQGLNGMYEESTHKFCPELMPAEGQHAFCLFTRINV